MPDKLRTARKFKAFSYYADCWGFSHRVVSRPDDTFDGVGKLHDYLDALTKQYTTMPCESFVFSDSLFIASRVTVGKRHFDGNTDRLRDLMAVVEQLSDEAFRLGLPMRGSLGVGWIKWRNRAVIGTALIDAYTTTERLEPVLPIACRATIQRAIDMNLLPPSVLTPTTNGDAMIAPFIDIPTKNGGIMRGRPMITSNASLKAAFKCLSAIRDGNDAAAIPDEKAAKTVRSTERLLTSWVEARK